MSISSPNRFYAGISRFAGASPAQARPNVRFNGAIVGPTIVTGADEANKSGNNGIQLAYIIVPSVVVGLCAFGLWGCLCGRNILRSAWDNGKKLVNVPVEQAKKLTNRFHSAPVDEERGIRLENQSPITRLKSVWQR